MPPKDVSSVSSVSSGSSGSGRVVAFFGDAFVDVQTSPMAALPAYGEDRIVERVSLFPGGSVVNTARSFGALTRETDVAASLCVSLGDDHLGTIMRHTLENEGSVDLSHVTTCQKTPMSTCLVLVGPGGERA